MEKAHIEALTPDDLHLARLLSKARAPLPMPGLAARVLESVDSEEAPQAVGIPQAVKPSGYRAGLLKAAAAVAAAAALWHSHQSSNQIQEENWIGALVSGEISPADLALIANLHEFIEAEVSSETNSAWLESNLRETP